MQENAFSDEAGSGERQTDWIGALGQAKSEYNGLARGGFTELVSKGIRSASVVYNGPQRHNEAGVLFSTRKRERAYG
tara:strand:- start:164 stop:394 length:231 start_codon:yes stop_codon:yes gene_type:complete